jgi:hypothetical protein
MNELIAGFRSVEDKKKLLWGNKAKVTSSSTPATWQESSQIFVDSDQQQKFLKLLGVKEGEEETPSNNTAPPHPSAKISDEAITRQAQVRQDLEQQFTLGLRHNISRTGLH